MARGNGVSFKDHHAQPRHSPEPEISPGASAGAPFFFWQKQPNRLGRKLRTRVCAHAIRSLHARRILRPVAVHHSSCNTDHGRCRTEMMPLRGRKSAKARNRRGWSSVAAVGQVPFRCPQRQRRLSRAPRRVRPRGFGFQSHAGRR